jgi:CubicO group peptidase (beta-lactamase class C family)
MDTESLTLYLQKMAKVATPGLSAVVLNSSSIDYQTEMGFRQVVPDVLPLTRDTLFDLASLTKVVGTLMATLRILEKKGLSLDMKLGFLLPNAGNYKESTIFQLLTHTSGLIAELRLENHIEDPQKAETFILSQPVRYKPGEKVEYSCFGYIILAKILERITQCPFDRLVKEEVTQPLCMTSTLFNPKQNYPLSCFAATEINNLTKNMLIGEVHDENSRFLGGIAGNAGLFSNTADLIRFCIMLLHDGQSSQGTFLSHETMELVFNSQTKGRPGENRTIGFKIEDPNLFGTVASKKTIGHTGFTGTSLAIDPKQNKAAILLTNRVHPSRENKILLDMRKGFHDLAFA